MGCSASRSLISLPPGDTAAAENIIRSREEYQENARAALARVRIIPAVQRRRLVSVGLPEEDGVFWVYWRPKQDEKRRREVTKTGATLFGALLSNEPNAVTYGSRARHS